MLVMLVDLKYFEGTLPSYLLSNPNIAGAHSKFKAVPSIPDYQNTTTLHYHRNTGSRNYLKLLPSHEIPPLRMNKSSQAAPLSYRISCAQYGVFVSNFAYDGQQTAALPQRCIFYGGLRNHVLGWMLRRHERGGLTGELLAIYESISTLFSAPFLCPSPALY